MHSATKHIGPVRRFRTLAFAATLALGSLAPALPVAMAQSTGFDVTVESVTELSGLTAVVSGSDGGLRLRAEASHDAEVLSSLADGTLVTLRIDTLDTVRDPDGTTRWWPVTVDGEDGWVSGFYLANPDAASSGESATPSNETSTTSETQVTGETFSFDDDSLIGATARVAGEGGSVNLRAAPSASADLVTTLSDGAAVNLRIDVLDTVMDGEIRWWPVTVDGLEGWVAGQFLTGSEDPVATSPLAAGSYAATFTGNGDGVNLRASDDPAADLLAILAEGTVVQIMEGPLSFTNSAAGWFKVTTGTTTGFVDGDLLRVASQPVSPADPATTTAFVGGDYALVQTPTQAGARLRAGSSPEAEKLMVVPESGMVQIVSGPASFESSDRGWFEVSYNGSTGYIDGDLLVRTEPPPTPEPTPAPTAAPQEAPVVTGNAFLSGDQVLTNSLTGVGVNVRVAPGTGAERIGYLADMSQLQVVEGPSKDTSAGDWYKVSNGELEGWVSAEFLQRQSDGSVAAPSETTAQFIVPVDDYIVSQNFGCSNLGYYAYSAAYGCDIHDGTDLATSAGTDIHASAAGTVVFAGWCDCGLGYYVEIDHGNGIHTVYGHMQRQPDVQVGDVVTQGQTIGPVGSTGLSTGPHVHFMFRVNGTAEDARNYVDFSR